MNIISFDEFYNFFQELITSKAAELYNDHLVDHELRFKCFKASGEYYDYLNSIKNGETTDDYVLVNIMNGGGVQDSSISIDTYLQIVSLEVMAREEYRYDLIELFTDIVANYKSYIGSFNTATYQLSIDNFPKFGDKYNALGDEYFNMSLVTNFIVMPGALLSNKITITIDGNDIKYNNMVMARTTELKSDMKKRTSQKFYPNTTGFQIQVSGLFVDNAAVRSLLSDCANASKFNQFYAISLVDNTINSTIYSGNLFSKDIIFTMAYGSIVAWTATFYEGTQL